MLIDPGYPVCTVAAPCTKPAKHVWLKFWRRGRVVARTRTNNRGKYRIALVPRTYHVTCSLHAAGKRRLEPQRVTVRRGRYRRVIFRLDTGIR